LITSEFGRHSTAEEVIAGIDLTGRRIVVTGASSGIGIETARVLALAGAEVTLAVRNVDGGQRVATAISESTDNPNVRPVALNLSNRGSIRKFVDQWQGPLHLLINNAGVMASPLKARPRAGTPNWPPTTWVTSLSFCARCGVQ
jgi:NAD(P)-dependent dehydrogenase (short-subunit alcohol dehydrogenase family)